MPDEIPASAQTSSEDSSQGQKMTIYMPQGAVIIERTDAEKPAEPQSAAVSEDKLVLPTVNEQAQPMGAVINIYTNDQSRGVSEPLQPVGDTAERTNTDEQQVLFRIAKILDGITERTTVSEEPPQPVGALICHVCAAHQQSVTEQAQPVVAAIPESSTPDEHQILYRIVGILDVITGRMGVNEQPQPMVAVIPEHISVNEQPQPMVAVIPEHISVNEQPQPLVAVIPEHISVGNIHGSKRHHLRRHYIDWWLHGINVFFIAFIMLATLIPLVLSTYFGIAMYASASGSMVGTINSGDLMISKLMPVSTLNVGDTVLLRDEHTWDLQVRRVTIISTSAGRDLTTIATESAAGNDSYTIKNATRIHKITSVIPKFGDLGIVFTSIFTKIGVGLFLLILNIVVHIRRKRKQPVDRK